jgi:hypothetical protein
MRRYDLCGVEGGNGCEAEFGMLERLELAGEWEFTI